MSPIKRNSSLRCSVFLGMATLTTVDITACNLVDDDEPPLPPAEVDTDTDGSSGDATCLEKAAEIQAECDFPQQFVAQWEEGGSQMVLVDDPAATIEIGPNGWLVQVSSAADYVGSYHYDGGTCTVGCGWCQPGQSLCYGGGMVSIEEGQLGCFQCIPFDAPDPVGQCAVIIEACGLLDDDGVDETGDGDDGADETGAGSEDGSFEVDEYDCSLWDPVGAVSEDEVGNLIVDAAVVHDLVAHYGDPLASCDGTRFRQRSDGYFAISDMATTGLLAQLGLLPGDVVLAIDGKAMGDVDAVANATVGLFLGSRTTSGFTVTIRRGRETFVKKLLVR